MVFTITCIEGTRVFLIPKKLGGCYYLSALFLFLSSKWFSRSCSSHGVRFKFTKIIGKTVQSLSPSKNKRKT